MNRKKEEDTMGYFISELTYEELAPLLTEEAVSVLPQGTWEPSANGNGLFCYGLCSTGSNETM